MRVSVVEPQQLYPLRLRVLRPGQPESSVQHDYDYFADVVHVAAIEGEGDVVACATLYPEETLTDEDVTERIAEFVREAALEGVSDELPHSIAVTVDDMIERDDKDLIEVYANLFVERDSQKGIIIGKGGARLKEVGARARGEIERLLGRKVFLALHVKVAKDWQRDPKQLGRLGF